MDRLLKKLDTKLEKSTAPIIRKLRNPFENNDRKLIIHCSHHKSGTSWFNSILSKIANYYGLNFSMYNENLSYTNYDIIFENHSRIDLSKFSNYRASHIIRDPRDIVISGYHYHLWTRESWAQIPMGELSDKVKQKWSELPLDEFKNLSYQQYLNTLSEEEGMLAEMKRTSAIPEIENWDYENENCFEIKYEDLIKDEQYNFNKIFKHYAFNSNAINKSLEFAEQNSFKNKTGRKLGQTAKKSHLRSGRLEQWKEVYTDKHKEYFKKRYGKLLIRLGYEKDMNW